MEYEAKFFASILLASVNQEIFKIGQIIAKKNHNESYNGAIVYGFFELILLYFLFINHTCIMFQILFLFIHFMINYNAMTMLIKFISIMMCHLRCC